MFGLKKGTGGDPVFLAGLPLNSLANFVILNRSFCMIWLEQIEYVNTKTKARAKHINFYT